MRKLEIALDDEVAQKLETYAAKLGLGVEAFLAQGIQQYADRFLSTFPTEWMPLDQWNALVRGEGCPLCNEVASSETVNTYGYTITDLEMGRLRLGARQFTPGYCVLICKKHVPEPYDLSMEERVLFFEDIMRAAQAIEKVFSPLKMNLMLLGNSVPHLHCHIIPRYFGDPVPNGPLLPHENVPLLSQQEYEERVKLIQAALATVFER
jgi:diadenosine tetraphosphate (Ap4A) HIT family hydrolase